MIYSIDGLSGVGGPTGTTGVQQKIASTGSSNQGVDFANVLADAALNITSVVKDAEAVSVSGLQGKASPGEVVQAVMEAEQALQVGLSVRDKVVAAYLELSRMAI